MPKITATSRAMHTIGSIQEYIDKNYPEFKQVGEVTETMTELTTGKFQGCIHQLYIDRQNKQLCNRCVYKEGEFTTLSADHGANKLC